MIRKQHTALLVVDVQEKLVNVMHERESLVDKLDRLIRGVRVLQLPVLLTEQYPRGLGPTIAELGEILDPYSPIEKREFSCCDNVEFVAALEQTGRNTILVSGIEAHVCVYQTVARLLDRGYQVEVVADAVDSRFPMDKQIALQKMRDLGARLTTVEMTLLELQQVARGDEFKAISRLIK